jgi:hypothetical protein
MSDGHGLNPGFPDGSSREYWHFSRLPGSLTQGTGRRSGFLSHADTVDSLTLMAKEIMSRLKQYSSPRRRRTRRALVT